MKIESILLGTLEVEEEQLYQFERGLYGLEEVRSFALIRPDESLPFHYLQAVEEPSVCLLVADPFVFRPEYEFDLSDEDQAALGRPEPEQVLVLVTVTALDDLKDATMNLLAPLVFHTGRRIGRQIVLHNTLHPIKTPLFPKKEEK